MISQVGYLQVVGRAVDWINISICEMEITIDDLIRKFWFAVPPNILDIESTPSSVAVRENQNINMTCRADGFPAPKIIWRREDGESITVERKKKGKNSR